LNLLIFKDEAREETEAAFKENKKLNEKSEMNRY
jgi:hypothetical protein